MDAELLPQTKPELDAFLDEHEADTDQRQSAYLAYARGDEEGLDKTLEATREWGELMMFALGNPCEPVPTDDPEPEPTPDPDAPAEVLTPEEAEELGLEPITEEEAMEPEEPDTDSGDEWKDAPPQHWTDQGEDWRG